MTCPNPHNKDWRKEIIHPTKCNSCISAGGGDCATCTPEPELKKELTITPSCGTCVIDRSKCPQYNDALEQLPCINHPQVREYLMKDVLGELETRLSKQSKESDRTCAGAIEYNATMFMRSRGIEQGYEEAITLIKNGVDK